MEENPLPPPRPDLRRLRLRKWRRRRHLQRELWRLVLVLTEPPSMVPVAVNPARRPELWNRQDQ
jgi:hypothetical protein